MGILSLFSVLMLAALVVAMVPRLSPNARNIALVPMIAAYVLLYVNVPEAIAQDRNNYYSWYQNAKVLLTDPYARDRLFSTLLSFFPKNLSPLWFSIFFSTLFFAILSFLALAVTRTIGVPAGVVPLLLLAVVCDRLFVDLSVNTTRSTLAAMVFTLAILQSNTLATLGLFFLSFGVHSRLFYVLFLIWIFAVLLQGRPVLVRAVFLGALASFFYAFATGESIVPFLEPVQIYLSTLDSQSVDRALTLRVELSVSLLLQTTLAVTLPGLLVFGRESLPPTERSRLLHPMSWVNKSPDILWNLGMLTAAVGLFLFPTLVLAQRLFFVPIFLLLFFVTPLQLRTVAVLKFVVLTFALTGQGW